MDRRLWHSQVCGLHSSRLVGFVPGKLHLEFLFLSQMQEVLEIQKMALNSKKSSSGVEQYISGKVILKKIMTNILVFVNEM